MIDDWLIFTCWFWFSFVQFFLLKKLNQFYVFGGISSLLFFVLFLVSFDGFILIHMSHFVNTNFVFSCYFSVLFSPRMPAISFHLAIVPSYLFIYHRSHIMSVMQTVTGNVCVNSNKSATRTSLFPCYFSCQSSHFPV